MLRKVLVILLLVVSVTGINLTGVPIEFTEDNDVISAVSDSVALKFSQEYIKYIKTGKESDALKQISLLLARSHSKRFLFDISISELGAGEQFFICTTCRAVVKVMAETIRAQNEESNETRVEPNGKKIFLEFCDRFNLFTPEVCSGTADLNWPILRYIILNSAADSRSLCGALPIKLCQTKENNFDWIVTIDNSTAPLTAAKSDIPMKTRNDLTIVQLTDIHYDPEYQPGSSAGCEEPICCRTTSTNGTSVEYKAGYWSDYRSCDSPLHMVESAFNNIRKNYKNITYIYQTGDIIPHTTWSTTKAENMAILTKINNLIAEKFPGIAVYPCIGNHESHPTNVFGHENVPAELSVNWLYEHLWTSWQRWLPAEAKATVLKGGYYSVSPKPGFRIISLNNNDCYIYNWWIYFDGNSTTQPQLDWLQETLLAAEKAGEYVHILAHIPLAAADFWSVCAREYNRVIERYSHIIGGIFGGHTHKDEMNLHYSTNGHPMAIYWNGGSLTSYSYKNPNYRVYEVEPKTYQVVDHHTWIFNLTEANEYGQYRSPRWFKEYQFTDFTKDLSPAGIDALIEKMAEEPDLLRQYWKYKITSFDQKVAAGCDEKCLSETLCRLVRNGDNNKNKRCEKLRIKLEKSLANELITFAPTEKSDDQRDGAGSITASVSSIVALLVAIFRLY